MALTRSLSKQESEEHYSRHWFAALAKFHQVEKPASWNFDEKQVIAFLRSKLAKGTPTWKRLTIVEGLILYRDQVRKSSLPELEPIRAKLERVVDAMTNSKHTERGPLADRRNQSRAFWPSESSIVGKVFRWLTFYEVRKGSNGCESRDREWN